MRVINCMFGKNLGGIEQAFLDYSTALNLQNNVIYNITHPNAKINQLLGEDISSNIRISNMGKWDVFAAYKLCKYIKIIKADIVICHGNRAISLMMRAAKGLAPVVGIAHNYNIKYLSKTDAAFTITNDLLNLVQESGQENTYIIPNMINILPNIIAQNFANNTTIHIGTLGRMVEKKGFEYFIHAIKILQKNHTNIKITIAGNGKEFNRLKALSKQLDLSKVINFTGWIDNQDDFFNDIDIFCLPSLHEPFGIVLLEAFVQAKPVVTTDSEGPIEIASHQKDALIVPKKDPQAMADALAQLIDNPDLAQNLAKNALITVKNNYDLNIISQKIQTAIEEITLKYNG